MAPKNSGLSCEDVCKILETSVKAGVVELKFNGLHVTFGRPAEQVPQSPAPMSVTTLTEEQHIQQTKQAIEQDEVTLREDQLARALVEDPVRYEELLRSGELTDGVDSADEDDGNGE